MTWVPRDEKAKEAVREQLGRILSSALFRNSKRFPPFLRYTVEHALESDAGLKERTIGHEVFGRDAGYDTGQDPIVRITAGEVRKRLSRYYASPEHATEPIVAFQPGSYVPEFHAPASNGAEAAAEEPPVAIAPPESGHARSWRPLLLAAVIAIAVMLTALKAWRDTPPGVVERFWEPVLRSSSSVLLCIGDPFSANVGRAADGAADANADSVTIEEFLQANSVRYTDAVTLSLLTGELRSRSKDFRIRRPAATELKDLRDGPVVLIGGFNNPWMLKMTEGLRFTLSTDRNGSYIRDRDRPESREWQIGARSTPLNQVRQTYGLITRVQDPATGQMLVSVSGLMLGTRAAGECVIDASCLSTVAQRAGANWTDRNLQIVVGAAVIGEDSGAPRVLETFLW